MTISQNELDGYCIFENQTTAMQCLPLSSQVLGGRHVRLKALVPARCSKAWVGCQLKNEAFLPGTVPNQKRFHLRSSPNILGAELGASLLTLQGQNALIWLIEAIRSVCTSGQGIQETNSCAMRTQEHPKTVESNIKSLTII